MTRSRICAAMTLRAYSVTTSAAYRAAIEAVFELLPSTRIWTLAVSPRSMSRLNPGKT
jgi:hypothetical protein